MIPLRNVAKGRYVLMGGGGGPGGGGGGVRTFLPVNFFAFQHSHTLEIIPFLVHKGVSILSILFIFKGPLHRGNLSSFTTCNT